MPGKPTVCGQRPLGRFSGSELVCSKSQQISRTGDVKPAVACVLGTRPPCVPAGAACPVAVAGLPALRAGSSSRQAPDLGPLARGCEHLGLWDGRLALPAARLPRGPLFSPCRSAAYTCSVTRQGASLYHLLTPSCPIRPLSRTPVALCAALPLRRCLQKRPAPLRQPLQDEGALGSFFRVPSPSTACSSPGASHGWWGIASLLSGRAPFPGTAARDAETARWTTGT